jgi:CheY-like chemotaxis protein
MNSNSSLGLGSSNDSVSALIYPTVLLAEDSQDTRIMLKRAFELKGYRVYEPWKSREVVNRV